MQQQENCKCIGGARVTAVWCLLKGEIILVETGEKKLVADLLRKPSYPLTLGQLLWLY